LGLQPKMVTEALVLQPENLKFLKPGIRVSMGIAKNRKVSINGEEYSQVQKLEIPDDGLVIQLKKVRGSKVFREHSKTQLRDTYLPYLTRMLLNRLADWN